MYNKIINSAIVKHIHNLLIYSMFQHIIKTKTHFNPDIKLFKAALFIVLILIISILFKFLTLPLMIQILIICAALSLMIFVLFGLNYYCSSKFYNNRFYNFAVFLNIKHKTNDFAISIERILQYKGENIILTENNNSQKKEYIVLKKSILDSRMSVQYNPYNEYSGKTTAKDTFIFDNCDVEEVIYMISLIDTFLINKNPAQQILARLKL